MHSCLTPSKTSVHSFYWIPTSLDPPSSWSLSQISSTSLCTPTQDVLWLLPLLHLPMSFAYWTLPISLLYSLFHLIILSFSHLVFCYPQYFHRILQPWFRTSLLLEPASPLNDLFTTSELSFLVNCLPYSYLSLFMLRQVLLSFTQGYL